MRRYKRGENSKYDQQYNQLLIRSWIINPELASRNVSTAGRLSGEDELKNVLLEWTGNKDGQLFVPDRNKNEFARIPLLRQQQKEIQEQFNLYNQQRLNNGYLPTKTWPEGLEDDRIKIEARLDIAQLEVEKLKKLLQPYLDEKEKHENEKVLKYGPRQSCWGEPIKIMDGQRVSQIKGVLAIDDSRSPYDGMPVHEYRKMATKWTQERSEKWNKDLEHAKKVYRDTGEEIHVQGINCPISRDKLPAWPEGVKSLKK